MLWKWSGQVGMMKWNLKNDIIEEDDPFPLSLAFAIDQNCTPLHTLPYSSFDAMSFTYCPHVRKTQNDLLYSKQACNCTQIMTRITCAIRCDGWTRQWRLSKSTSLISRIRKMIEKWASKFRCCFVLAGQFCSCQPFESCQFTYLTFIWLVYFRQLASNTPTLTMKMNRNLKIVFNIIYLLTILHICYVGALVFQKRGIYTGDVPEQGRAIFLFYARHCKLLSQNTICNLQLLTDLPYRRLERRLTYDCGHYRNSCRSHVLLSGNVGGHSVQVALCQLAQHVGHS